MAKHIGFGPVFTFECLTTSRRWQVYAGRALLVTGVLVGLTLVGCGRAHSADYAAFSAFPFALPS